MAYRCIVGSILAYNNHYLGLYSIITLVNNRPTEVKKLTSVPISIVQVLPMHSLDLQSFHSLSRIFSLETSRSRHGKIQQFVLPKISWKIIRMLHHCHFLPCLLYRTREATKIDRKISRVDELISETSRNGVFVTPPIKATKLMSKSVRDRYDRGLETSPHILTPGSNKSGSVGNLTPEQLQNLLKEFDESADGISGAYDQKLTPDRPFETSLGSTRTIYRPSAVEKGTSATPLRADGRPTQSPLSQRHRVMHNLGITESALEESIEKLREWFADKVIHSLQKKLATAHIDVIQSAERLGVSGIPLTPLKDFSNDLSSQIADDESTLSELKTRVQDYLRHYTNSPNQELMTCLNSIHAYQQLKLLLVGKYPSGFLQSPQNGYILKRLSDLSKGTCLMDFEWNKGGDFNRRSWSTELPTDSALLLYLFAAYIIAPNWNFTDEDPNRLEGSGGVLYVAQVPPRSVSDYFAVLTTRPPTGSRVSFVLIFFQSYTKCFNILV